MTIECSSNIWSICDLNVFARSDHAKLKQKCFNQKVFIVRLRKAHCIQIRKLKYNWPCRWWYLTKFHLKHHIISVQIWKKFGILLVLFFRFYFHPLYILYTGYIHHIYFVSAHLVWQKLTRLGIICSCTFSMQHTSTKV